METDFKKSLGICQHVMEHSRDLFLQNSDLNTAYDELKRDADELRERENANALAIAQAEKLATENQQANHVMEEELAKLKEEKLDRDEQLLKLEQEVAQLTNQLEEEKARMNENVRAAVAGKSVTGNKIDITSNPDFQALQQKLT